LGVLMLIGLLLYFPLRGVGELILWIEQMIWILLMSFLLLGKTQHLGKNGHENWTTGKMTHGGNPSE